MKKVLCFALTLMIVLGAVGCNNGAQNESTVKAELMVVNESKNNDPANYMIVKLFKEKFNIDLTLTQNAINGHLEKLKLLAASNELPDIISPLPETESKSYGPKGALIPIVEHLDGMPNLKKYLDQDKIVYASMMANDGHAVSYTHLTLPTTSRV